MADKVYTMSRRRSGVFALTCVAAFAVSYWLSRDQTVVKSVPLGYGGMVLSAGYGFFYAMLTLAPVRLTLTDEGFELRRWTGRERVAWRDIEPVEVWRVSNDARVVYTYREGRLPAHLPILHRITHAFGNYDGALPGALDVGNEDLCAEMNVRRGLVVGA